MSGLQVTIDQVDGIHVVRLGGRLDAVTASALEIKLNPCLEGEGSRVVIDFSSVEYLSSAGMRLLLATSKKVAASKGKLALCCLGEEVMEIIRMAGFERILAIFPTESAAIESIK